MTRERVHPLERVAEPAQTPEAEMAVLGAILQDHAAFVTVRKILEPDDFYQDAHRLIFTAALAVADDRGEAVDLVTVTNELRRAGKLDDAGSSAYLSNLAAAVSTIANLQHHASLVREAAAARRVADLARHVADLASRGDGWRVGVQRLVEFAQETRTAGASDLTVGAGKFSERPPEREWDIRCVRLRGDNGWTSGPPKAMKSLTLLEEARAQSTGTPFLGHFPTRKARCLLVGLQDREDRVHGRFHEMLVGRPPEEIPSSDDLRFLLLPSLQLDTSEGLELLQIHLDRWRPEVVYVENFSDLHSRNPRQEEDVKVVLRRLNRLRQDFDCPFRVIVHDRKESRDQPSRRGEMISGSQALWGWSESSVFVSPIKRGLSECVIDLKDGEPAEPYLIEFGAGKLLFAGAVRPRQRDRDMRILEFLDDHPGSTTGEIAQELKRTERTVRDQLKKLERGGGVVGSRETSRQPIRWSRKLSTDLD